jgi:pyruvate dehydrogenase E1 component beta subunit
MPWDEGLVSSLQYDAPDPAEGRVLSYPKAINEALALALDHDPSVIVLGQGVDDPSAMFGTTRGLQERFGSPRVFDTPLSEEAMMGVSAGAAMNGLRPVYMHNRPDFILLAMNQLVTHAAKMHFMDNGLTKVPMVVWAAIGRGWGSGAQHSQAIQGVLLGVPGLKIVMPSTPHDAKGLLLAAIADNNPVCVFEHRWLMKKDGIVPEGMYRVPIGRAIRRREGVDVSIVGASHAIELGLQAAGRLAADGIEADVIDLRTIKPLDEAAILESLAKTGRLLVVDTGWMMGGVCAEVGCLAAERGFASLKAPVCRVGLPDMPTPAGFALEQFYYPDAARIAEAARRLVKDGVATTPVRPSHG